MASDDIRIAWNLVTHRLCAVHPDDGAYTSVEVAFGENWAELPVDLQDRACAPGGRRLMIGPSLAEIREAFEREHVTEPSEPC